MSAGDIIKNPAYTLNWKGNKTLIIFDETPIAQMFLGHGVIYVDQLLHYLNAAYLEGYMQKERELGITTIFEPENT